MSELSSTLHPLVWWLCHQWWFIGGLLALGLVASEAARHAEE